ncbi:1-phosphofructokinase [Vagococcus penaei]|uniref:Tagatose-6-phosphate kinase n=1 Tax=Vagococcus penaei TaxID=633807 RepID=A0A1Q2D6Y5_9ENTE|nr:1-phosphofructokinase [Vagococcus penaei]AQP54083.1 1-phosphofructokinase [Vagococcus penaei]RST98491.1 1-phosphofructokinase [Vagococcus penaei]
MIYTVTLNPAIDYVIRVPEFKTDQLNKTTEEFKFPGGKGINVSRILKNLGTESINLGFIGGFTGSFVKDALAQEDLRTDFVEVSEDTRINIKLKSDVETEINGQGPTISADSLAELKAQLARTTEKDLVVFSGSIPKGLPHDVYNELIQVVKENNAHFVVDISSDSLFDILPFGPEFIKPNHHELADLFDVTFNSIEDMIPYGKKLIEMGSKNVLISMGGDGALLFTQSGVYRAPGLKGKLKNSVGAGDSMVAGFVNEFVKSNDSIEAFKYGVAAGSATAFSDDLATGEAILSLVSDVAIEQVK